MKTPKSTKVIVWVMIGVAIIASALLAGAAVANLGLIQSHRPDELGPRLWSDSRSQNHQSQNQDTADQTSHAWLGATERYRITVDELEREFIVYRPSKLDPNQPTPLVFMLHGGGGTGERFYKISGWKDKADQEGLTVVFPTALRYHAFEREKTGVGYTGETVSVYDTRWAAYVVELDPEYPDQVLADDVAFMRDMVNFVQSKYAIDAARVYVNGFSNGGYFTNRLMLEASDIFAAFGNTGSGFRDSDYEVGSTLIPDDFVPRPLLATIGANDEKATAALGVTTLPFGESAVSQDGVMWTRFFANYLDVLGLDDSYSYKANDKVTEFIFDQPAVTGLPDNLEYRLQIVKGLEHIYPGTQQSTKAQAQFFGPDVYWEFFKQYSL